MSDPKSDWLKNSLREFATEVPARRAKCQNESQTRSYLIDPFLCRIGWNTHDPSQVFVEFTPNFAKTRETVDYALLQEDQPIVLIEAKSVGNKVPAGGPQSVAALRRLHWVLPDRCLDERDNLVLVPTKPERS